ncbi:MAG: hypothetical protein ACP5IL_14185 [Syntrophobacteraceae bacterium]
MGLGKLWRQTIKNNGGGPVAYPGKIVMHPHFESGIRRAAKRLFKADRHFRRDAALRGNDVVKLPAGDASPLAACARFKPRSSRQALSSLPGCAGFFITMALPSPMVIDNIHVESSSVFKPGNNLVVCVLHEDSRRKKSFQLALEQVQSESLYDHHAFNRSLAAQRQKRD